MSSSERGRSESCSMLRCLFLFNSETKHTMKIAARQTLIRMVSARTFMAAGGRLLPRGKRVACLPGHAAHILRMAVHIIAHAVHKLLREAWFRLFPIES